MSLFTAKPHPALQGLIIQYSSLEIDNATMLKDYPTGSFRLPDSHIRIAFHISDQVPWMEVNGNKFLQPRQNIRGLQLQPVTFNSSHPVEVFTIEFTPAGILSLLGIPCKDLTIEPLELKSILNESILFMQEKLADYSSFQKQVSLLNSFFLKQVVQGYESQQALRILSFIKEQPCTPSVDELSKAAFITTRSMRRFFANNFGLSPKLFLRLTRFENAIEAVKNQPDLQLSEIAYLTGYFDQAHFTTEIRKFTGMTPGELREKLKVL